MTIEEIIQRFNSEHGNIIPKIDNAIIDICSLMDVIDTTKSFSFKFSLFPAEAFEQLLDFSDTSFSEALSDVESLLNDKMRWIAFYPKYNTMFEKMMHVPILNLDMIEADDEIKSAFQIPIMVKYYILFNNTLNTISRYYNSNVYVDHTSYMLIPNCILNQYNFSDLFAQTEDSTVPYLYPDIWDYGIDFTYMNNFDFIIDDPDVYAQRKNIVFIEISLSSDVKNFSFQVMTKDGSDIYMKEGKTSKLSYRKVFYNADYINIKNRIVKYND